MDLNGDGHKDILSGSYSRQSQDMAGLFQVLWGDGQGGFKKAETLKGTDGEPLIIKKPEGADVIEIICTRPFAVDWNGNGHLDLVVGNFAGGFYLFTGEGKGRFVPGGERMMLGDKPLKVPGHHGDPFCIDWDRDGDLDLMSGSTTGGVYWAENVADKGKSPKLAGFQTLIKPGKRHEYGAFLVESDLHGPAADSRIWVDDVNGDGKLDILVGDNVTLVSAAEGLTKAECKERMAAWEKRSQELQTKMREAKAEDERRELNRAFSAHYGDRKKFVKEERTGFVWLYLQKAL